MAEKQLISTIKYIAASKPVFFLSEILPYLDDPLPVPEIYCILSPRFPSLGLVAEEIKGDIRITRIPPMQPYVLNPEELRRLDSFFTTRSIPDFLSQGIEGYITR